MIAEFGRRGAALVLARRSGCHALRHNPAMLEGLISANRQAW
jgi:hypothetical protein